MIRSPADTTRTAAAASRPADFWLLCLCHSRVPVALPLRVTCVCIHARARTHTHTHIRAQEITELASKLSNTPIDLLVLNAGIKGV